jgi:hypothetical protein
MWLSAHAKTGWRGTQHDGSGRDNETRKRKKKEGRKKETDLSF